MNRPFRYGRPLCAAGLLAALFLAGCASPDPDAVQALRRPPLIDPDYSGIEIPPNLAPLNFRLLEKAEAFRVEAEGAEGTGFRFRGRGRDVIFPAGPWRRLLAANRGRDVRFSVTVLDSSGLWRRFDPIVNRVSRDSIDGFLVYRKMPPVCVFWKRLSVVERDLGSFRERVILDNRAMGDGCFNCHTFHGNRTDRWLAHLRGAPSTAMLLTVDGRTRLMTTRTESVPAAAAYASWHPDGRTLAFANMKVKQFFHTAGPNRDVYDLTSDLAVCRIDSAVVAAPPEIADPARLETYPAWAPDGRTLYFCSAPAYDTTGFFERHTYRRIKYDLMKVPFDPGTGRFGRPVTVLAAARTGLSATHPRVSPDGRFLLFCLCEYGNFSIYRPGTDLYLMDLETGAFRRLECNSGQSDSYHSWSSGSRWFVFSSKRGDGVLARPYFAHVDPDGAVSKPFVLPQKDPGFYGSHLYTFNVPELIAEPVRPNRKKLLDAALDTDRTLKSRSAGPAPAPSGNSAAEEQTWRPAR
ncbi:MAG: cytochrome C biosynthesis protein [bacterium]|nr:cytochrome C biosynthesis protein [bacterium]